MIIDNTKREYGKLFSLTRRGGKHKFVFISFDLLYPSESVRRYKSNQALKIVMILKGFCFKPH